VWEYLSKDVKLYTNHFCKVFEQMLRAMVNHLAGKIKARHENGVAWAPSCKTHIKCIFVIHERMSTDIGRDAHSGTPLVDLPARVAESLFAAFSVVTAFAVTREDLPTTIRLLAHRP
jgi:hypothetical protein